MVVLLLQAGWPFSLGLSVWLGTPTAARPQKPHKPLPSLLPSLFNSCYIEGYCHASSRAQLSPCWEWGWLIAHHCHCMGSLPLPASSRLPGFLFPESIIITAFSSWVRRLLAGHAGCVGKPAKTSWGQLHSCQAGVASYPALHTCLSLLSWVIHPCTLGVGMVAEL